MTNYCNFLNTTASFSSALSAIRVLPAMAWLYLISGGVNPKDLFPRRGVSHKKGSAARASSRRAGGGAFFRMHPPNPWWSRDVF